MQPRIHSTPPDAVTETARDEVAIDNYLFRIDHPADPDKLFDHPAVRSAYAADEFIPYWATLWPAAKLLAAAVVREPWAADAGPVLEVGCGLGLAGVAALARGLRVTFSDIDETALLFAEANARLNGFDRGFRCLPLDFRSPPTDRQYRVVLGSDLIYEDRLVNPLIDFLDAVLDPAGVCLITDPDRLASRRFRWTLGEAGFDVDPSPLTVGEAKGTLYRIRFADR